MICKLLLSRRKVTALSVKIKVSYERPEELQRILDKLQPDIEHWKASGNQEGRFKKAYIVLQEQREVS